MCDDKHFPLNNNILSVYMYEKVNKNLGYVKINYESAHFTNLFPCFGN